MLSWLETKGWVVAGVFGAILFLVIGGWPTLDVGNLAWLGQRFDPAMNLIGWEFYRDTPWAHPIAHNPRYGLEYSGSILFSDSLPLLAIPFKALSFILPRPFQYFGWWAFGSFVLHGVCGWWLMGPATKQPVARILGAALLSLTPIYGMRFADELGSHISMTAQWLILASLALCVSERTPRSPWAWGLILFVGIFVHPYLFLMCVGLWYADLARVSWLGNRLRWQEPLLVIGALTLIVFVTGIFRGPELSAPTQGFGAFNLNLLALFDSQNSSWLFPDIPGVRGDHEGFAYLGLGGGVLVALAGWNARRVLREHPLRFQHAPLALMFVFFFLFAIATELNVGPWTLYSFSWPVWMMSLGDSFRASGRFIWPLYYFLFFAVVHVLARRFSPRVLAAILAVAVVAQAIDILPGWEKYRSYLNKRGPKIEVSIGTRFWERAVERGYKKIRLLPHKMMFWRYREISSFAAAHGMATDVVHLARTSTTARNLSQKILERGIAGGEWDRDTIFVFDQQLPYRVRRTLEPKRHLFGRVDQLVVLAPGWADCQDCEVEPF